MYACCSPLLVNAMISPLIVLQVVIVIAVAVLDCPSLELVLGMVLGEEGDPILTNFFLL